MPFTPAIQIQTGPMRANLAANQQAAQNIQSGLTNILSAIDNQQKQRAEQEVLTALSQANNPDEVRSVLGNIMAQRSEPRGFLDRISPSGRYGGMTDAEKSARASLLGQVMVPESQRMMDRAKLEDIQARTQANRALATRRATGGQSAVDKNIARVGTNVLKDKLELIEQNLGKIKQDNPDIEAYRPEKAGSLNMGEYVGSDSKAKKKLALQRQYNILSQRRDSLRKRLGIADPEMDDIASLNRQLEAAISTADLGYDEMDEIQSIVNEGDPDKLREVLKVLSE